MTHGIPTLHIPMHDVGPLTDGDIEDIAGKTTLVCPWHHYRVDVQTGEKYYEGLDKQMRPCGWQSAGVRQRIHPVTVEEGRAVVTLGTGPRHVESDRYATM